MPRFKVYYRMEIEGERIVEAESEEEAEQEMLFDYDKLWRESELLGEIHLDYTDITPHPLEQLAECATKEEK